MESAVGPRAQLVADAIAERVSDTLHLVFVLAFQNCEENFSRGSHQRISGGATRYLEKSQQRQTWRNRHCTEPERTEKWQRHERKRHAEPLEKTAGEKNLDHHSESVDPDFEIREE